MILYKLPDKKNVVTCSFYKYNSGYDWTPLSQNSA